MADRAGQALAWPVPSDAGLSPPYGLPPNRVTTADGSFYLSEEIRKMPCPPFKLVRHPGHMVQAANYLGGFRDV